MVKDVAAAIFGLTPDSPASAAHSLQVDRRRPPDPRRRERYVDIVANHDRQLRPDEEVDFSSIYYDAKQRSS